jgi:hypothetical protein
VSEFSTNAQLAFPYLLFLFSCLGACKQLRLRIFIMQVMEIGVSPVEKKAIAESSFTSDVTDGN